MQLHRYQSGLATDILVTGPEFTPEHIDQPIETVFSEVRIVKSLVFVVIHEVIVGSLE